MQHDVRVFGAVGNGITDDTIAIQSALNAAKNGGTVWFPAGSYRVTRQLVIDGGVLFDNKTLLAGERRTSSEIYYDGTDSPAVVVTGTGAHARAIGVRDLRLRANHTRVVDGLYIDGGWQENLEINRVTFENWRGGCALTLRNGWEVVIRDVMFRSGTVAIRLGAEASGIGMATLDNLNIHSTLPISGPVVDIRYGRAVVWRGGGVQAAYSGIHLYRCAACALDTLYFEGNFAPVLIDLEGCTTGRIDTCSFVARLGTNQAAVRFWGGGGTRSSMPTVMNCDFAGFERPEIILGNGDSPAYGIVTMNNQYSRNTLFQHYEFENCRGNVAELHHAAWVYYDAKGNVV